MDTHIWLWTLDGSYGQMCRAAAELIERAAADRRLFVSDISWWEISMKVSKGRLRLSIDSTLWLNRAAAAPGIQGIPISRDVLIQSTLLPGEMHGDPADCMLIAQAQLADMSLITCDSAIVKYAKRQPGVPVCDAR